MVLTSAGYKLLHTAEQVLDLLDDSELAIAQLAGGESGELKIGTHCIFCFKWLPQVLADFRTKFPNVAVEIGTSYDPSLELDQKQYDVIISARPLPEHSYTLQPLFQDQLVCIMENDHPLAKQDYIRLQDFDGISLISHTEKDQSKLYELLLQPQGVEPERFMTVGQPQAIVELVTSGFGVGVFPLWAITSAVEAGTVAAKPITKSGISLTWAALSLHSNNLPLYQQEFVRMMQKKKVLHLPPQSKGDQSNCFC